jgi:hypothetical protein
VRLRIGGLVVGLGASDGLAMNERTGSGGRRRLGRNFVAEDVVEGELGALNLSLNQEGGSDSTCDSIMTMTRDAQKEANELRKAEIEANAKSFEQMASAVSRIEGMKADPVAAAFKALKPFALKAGLYTAGAASEFVEEAGGVKPALFKIVSALGGGGKSEVFDKILQTIGAVAPVLGGGVE